MSSTTTGQSLHEESLDASFHDKEIETTYHGHDTNTHPNEGTAQATEGNLQEKESSDSKHGHDPREDATNVDLGKKGAEEVIAENDPNIVYWDGPDDPANPLNWSAWIKFVNIFIISAICFITPLASSMFAPGVPELMTEFKVTSTELGAFVVSVYILGFAFGPLLLAPASELYGRIIVYHVSNVMFVIFNVACALSTNMGMLIGFRFLAGCFGAAPITIGGGSISDLTYQESRAKAMSGFVVGPLLGPVIGPIAGGFLAKAEGWRWVFWVLSICSGLLSVLAMVFLRETYAVTILDRKAKRLQKETGNLQLRSKLDLGLTAREMFWRSIVRPAKMLVLSPIVLALSVYMGIVYGYLYLLFTTLTFVFEGQYGFSPSTVGLTFLGLGIGSMLGLGVFGAISNIILKKKGSPAADGSGRLEMKAEYRMLPMIPGSALIPIGLFLYGWSAYYSVQYVVPILGTCILGIGNLAVFMSINLYLIDAFTIYAASALAANAVIRSIAGAVLPLAGERMYGALGLGWGNSLLAFIAVALIPVPWFLYTKGEWLRNKFPMKGL